MFFSRWRSDGRGALFGSARCVGGLLATRLPARHRIESWKNKFFISRVRPALGALVNISVIDYGMGNVKSILNMLKKVGVPGRAAVDAQSLRSADALILPGVGAFDAAIEALGRSGLRDTLDEQVLGKRVPVLGICLGAQLLTERSDEGKQAGLRWIRGETVRFDRSRLPAGLPIPHMGWSDVLFNPECPISAAFRGTDPRFYFVHSYHLRPADDRNVMATATYGVVFAAGIWQDNIFGCQFHPEKSHRFGMRFLTAFAEHVRGRAGPASGSCGQTGASA